MLIVGWQKTAKEVGYAGINKCNNCKNYSHFKVYELATEPTVYWAPIFKIKSRILVACGLCNASMEIDPQKRKEFLESLNGIPPIYAFEAIWLQLKEQFNLVINNYRPEIGLYQESAIMAVESFRDRMAREYDSERGRYVLERFIQYVIDPDKPR